MKQLCILITFFAIIIFACPSIAASKKPLNAAYYEDLFQMRIQELLKTEFVKEQKKVKSNKNVLIKRLRELLDNEIKTI